MSKIENIENYVGLAYQGWIVNGRGGDDQYTDLYTTWDEARRAIMGLTSGLTDYEMRFVLHALVDEIRFNNDQGQTTRRKQVSLKTYGFIPRKTVNFNATN